MPEGVSKVSGGCLGDSNTAWRVIIPNKLTKLHLSNIGYCLNWQVPFLSMILDWPLSALFWGVCRVSVKSQGVVLG